MCVSNAHTQTLYQSACRLPSSRGGAVHVLQSHVRAINSLANQVTLLKEVDGGGARGRERERKKMQLIAPWLRRKEAGKPDRLHGGCIRMCCADIFRRSSSLLHGLPSPQHHTASSSAHAAGAPPQAPAPAPASITTVPTPGEWSDRERN